jgi:hypothetical protein
VSVAEPPHAEQPEQPPLPSPSRSKLRDETKGDTRAKQPLQLVMVSVAEPPHAEQPEQPLSEL